MAILNGNYKVYNGSSFDQIDFATTAKQVSIADTGGVLASTNAEDAIIEVDTKVESHLTDATKHITSAERTAWNAKQSALGYAPVNKAGDTILGVLVAQNNTSYTTKQIRNVTLSISAPSGGDNGDIWFVYTP